MDREIFTVAQAAEYLQLRKETILRKIYSGDIRAGKIGKEWRIQKCDLLAYLNSNLNVNNTKD